MRNKVKTQTSIRMKNKINILILTIKEEITFMPNTGWATRRAKSEQNLSTLKKKVNIL